MISLPHHTYSAREEEITQLFTEQHLLIMLPPCFIMIYNNKNEKAISESTALILVKKRIYCSRTSDVAKYTCI